jgi:hypothetical protein
MDRRHWVARINLLFRDDFIGLGGYTRLNIAGDII